MDKTILRDLINKVNNNNKHKHNIVNLFIIDFNNAIFNFFLF